MLHTNRDLSQNLSVPLVWVICGKKENPGFGVLNGKGRYSWLTRTDNSSKTATTPARPKVQTWGAAPETDSPRKGGWAGSGGAFPRSIPVSYNQIGPLTRAARWILPGAS